MVNSGEALAREVLSIRLPLGPLDEDVPELFYLAFSPAAPSGSHVDFHTACRMLALWTTKKSKARS